MKEHSLSISQRTGILITLLLSAFITAMSTTVTGNMIPNIMTYFSVSSGAAQWLTSGATLLSGIIIPITAFLIKKIPNKYYYLSAMVFFSAGSLSACTASSFSMLLISRLVQALGCGMLLSFAQVIILTIYPREKHGTMMAMYSMAASVSSMIGPTYAGLIMDTVGWRGVFLSLFAVGAILVVMGVAFMCNVTSRQESHINMFYVLLSSIGFLTYIIGLNNIKCGAFHLNSGGMMAIGILSLTVFSAFQLHSDKPMLNLYVFRNSKFRLGVFLTICMYLICMGNAMILPIYAKIICGYSDTSYGLATIAGALISLLATLFAGRIYDKIGIKPMSVVTVLAFGIYSVIGIFASKTASITQIGIMYALQSIGMAAMISPVTTMALSELKDQLRVDGSAIFNTLRQISSSVATTTAVLLFTLFGGELDAFHKVYLYFGLVTVVILLLVVVFLFSGKKKLLVICKNDN